MKLYFFLLLFFCYSYSFAQVDKSNYALLWEITGNGLEKPSYLFGTMHVQDERAHEFSDSVLVCLDATESFAMEVNIDSILTEFLELYISGDTTNVLKQKLSPEAYDRLNKKIKEETGESIEEMENKDPMFLEGLITDWDEPAYTVKKEQVVDMYLMKRAVEQGHANFGLEKLDDYIGMTFSYFDRFEKDQMDDGEFTDSLYEKLIEIYRSGDISIIEKEYIGKPGEDRSSYDIESLDNRNIKMVNNLVRLMKGQSVFCAVGVAHLPGKKGMLEELRQKGYSVRKVQATFKGYAQDYKKTVEKKWKRIENPDFLFSIKAPGQTMSMESMLDDFGDNSIANMNMDFFDMHAYMHMVLDLKEMLGDTELKPGMERVFLENWSADGGEILSQEDVNRDGAKGVRFFTTDEEANKMIWEIYMRNNLIYMFCVFCEGNEVKADNMEAYFGSIEWLQPQWTAFAHEQGAFKMLVPKTPTESRRLHITEYDDLKDRTSVYKTFVAKDVTSGMSYIVRMDNLGEGVSVHNLKDNLTNKVSAFTEKWGEPASLSDSVFFKGFPAIKVRYKLSKSDFDMYVVNRGSRSMVIGVECPEGADCTEDKKRFMDSFEFLPFKVSELELKEFSGESYSIKVPGDLVTDTTVTNGYPYFLKYNHTATDSLCVASFDMAVMKYNPFYMPTPDDQLYVNFQKEMRDRNGPGMRDTLFQGREAVYSESTSENSLNTYYALSFFEDLYYFDLSVAVPPGLDKSYAWSFFNSFNNNRQYEKGYMAKDKKAAFWAALSSKDSLTFDFARKTMNGIELSTADLPKIQQLLYQQSIGDAEQTKEVKSLLIREFKYTKDKESIPFLKKLYKDGGLDRDLKIRVLDVMLNEKSELGFNTFFKLEKDLPNSIEVQYDYDDMFQNFEDTLSLSKNYVDQLMGLTDDPSFAYYTYNFFVSACRADSSYIDLLQPHLPALIAQANEIVDQNKLHEAREFVAEFDKYYHFNVLNFLFGLFESSKELDPYFDRLQQLPSAFLMVNIIDAMLARGMEVPTEAYEIVAKRPYSWQRLLNNLNVDNRERQIPAHLFTPEKMVEAVAAKTIEDEYDEMINFKLLETRSHQHQGKDFRIYIFTFGVSGYDGDYLGVCSQPTDKVQLKGNYFYYFTEEYDPETKEASITKILNAWDK